MNLGVYYGGSPNGRSKKAAEYMIHRIRAEIDADYNLLAMPLSIIQTKDDLYGMSPVILIFIATHENGSIPLNADTFNRLVNEMKNAGNDERYYGVVGLGCEKYEENYGLAAKNIDMNLEKLNWKRIWKLQLISDDMDLSSKVTSYAKLIRQKYKNLKNKENTNNGCCGNDNVCCGEDEEDEDEDESRNQVNIDQNSRSMLSESVRKVLQGQGYRIVGTHSAVKLCRWTKSHMKGRGGCYKHTFYGISSMNCMETTTSLSCANKCVFCWRHNSNPVGTKWHWMSDSPKHIVDEFLRNHRSLVSPLSGIVCEDRRSSLDEIKHCALSLVGEPIMYPYINDIIEILHNKRISTFLVTNGQFPSELLNLAKVTQLYISIDAPNQKVYRKIDRPIFRDAWAKLHECVLLMKQRKERTVFRMTLIKDINMHDIMGYVELIRVGEPDFIEIKGYTYNGKWTKESNIKLGMENVPWYKELQRFSLDIINSCDYMSLNYDVSLIHQHSNSILISHKRFYSNGKWHTWIDYDKFFDLEERRKEKGIDFDSIEYSVESPKWTLWGSAEMGFDPLDKRLYRNRKNISIKRMPSEDEYHDSGIIDM